jgi:hypothetical protein
MQNNYKSKTIKKHKNTKQQNNYKTTKIIIKLADTS